MLRPHLTHRSMTMLLAATVSVALAGCANPLNPDAPKDPGTVVVHVNDDTGAPVFNAYVEITQPNHLGGEFGQGAWTDTAGVRTFRYIPAGPRPVAVTPPAGYKPGPGGTKQVVSVLKGKSVT